MLSTKDIKKRLLDETPVQWCVYLEMAERRLKEYGFNNLREFITTPVNKGGIGIPLIRARELITFNPAYEHKAKRLLEVIGVEEEIKDELNSGKTQQQVADERGISQSRINHITQGNNNKHRRDMWMPVSPEDAVKKIIEKFGEDFARQLGERLLQ